MKRILTLVLATGLATLLLSACGGNVQWKTTNITNVMPDLQFTLTDENGQVVHANKYRGKIKLVYFGYTHCPDVCPLTLHTIKKTLKNLGAQASAVRVLFVSVDPKRDTPAVLKKYTAWYGPDFIGLTGTKDQLQTLTKRYRVSYSYGKPQPDGSYVVNHSSAIFVFDRKGEVRLLMGRKDGVAAMTHDLNRLITEP